MGIEMMAQDKQLEIESGVTISPDTTGSLKSMTGKALRIRAENKAREIITRMPEDMEVLSHEEIRKTFFELRVHQIELEMQNQELWQAQVDLETERTRYFDLYDLAPVGYCILSEKGLILEANLTATKMLGVPRGELVDQPINRFIFAEYQDAFYLQCHQIFETRKPQSCEMRMMKQNGLSFWAQLATTLNQDKDQAPVYRVVMSDISDRKRIEEELLKMQKIESLGHLAGGIAHDFNNILMAILGNISFVKMTLSPTDEAYTRLTAAEAASMRAKTLTQQFLTFSSGGAPVKHPFSIANRIKDWGQFALSGAKSTCEYSIANDLWDVDADNDQITQVMTNILMNADQSMQNGGIIKVVCENVLIGEEDDLALPRGRFVKISIKDQGNGIPGKNLNSIFDPYFTTKEAGRGLGLAAAYSIMKKHEGHIAVESTADTGTTFSLYLLASAVQTEHIKTVNEAEFIAGKGKILVMDDDEIVLKVIETMLNYLGYQVELAVNGEEAIAKYINARQLSRPFDAVIMDLIIPGGMGGKEAIQKLLAIAPQAKVIVSSGYSYDPVMAEYEKYGFRGVIAKPYHLAELSEQMQQLLFT